MDKVKIDFQAREWIELKDWGILVKPFISFEDQIVLINLYLDELFDKNRDSKYNHLWAENILIMSVLDMNTNLKLFDETLDEAGNQKALVKIDTIYENFKLWNQVEKAIVNFPEVKREILKAAENKREELRLRASLGFALNDIYEKATAFFTSLSEKGISDEDIEKYKGLLKEANDSPILKAIVEKVK